MKKNETKQCKTVLDTILSNAQTLIENGVTPRFVFDLDSTLFCVSPRTEHILKKFAKEDLTQNLFPEAAKKLGSIKSVPEDWGIKTILNRHEVKESLQFFEAAREYWIQHFFSNHFLNKDLPYSGAVEFVNHVHQMGIEVFYLTGRDRKRMELGTIESLSQHGFPLSDPSCLNMKPDASFGDTEYKVSVFSSWNEKDLSRMWFFENEPVIINQVREKFPDLHIIYMDSVHSGRESAPAKTPTISFKWNFSAK